MDAPTAAAAAAALRYKKQWLRFTFIIYLRTTYVFTPRSGDEPRITTAVAQARILILFLLRGERESLQRVIRPWLFSSNDSEKERKREINSKRPG